MGGANVIWDMGGGFADQFKVAQRGVVIQSARHETGLVESVGVGEYLSGKVDHVIKVEAPCALASIRH